MGVCYASQAYKGEIGRIRASTSSGLFISFSATAFVMLGILARHFSLPDWLLFLTPIAIAVLGDKLVNACYRRVPFAALSIQAINEVLLVTDVFLVLVALLALSFLLTLINTLKSQQPPIA